MSGSMRTFGTDWLTDWQAWVHKDSPRRGRVLKKSKNSKFKTQNSKLKSEKFSKSKIQNPKSKPRKSCSETLSRKLWKYLVQRLCPENLKSSLDVIDKSPPHSCFISMLVKTLNINKPPQSVSICICSADVTSPTPKKGATKNAQKKHFWFFLQKRALSPF